MKKVFIGLLVIAAGAGVYYLLQNKKTTTENSIQKELLTGNWKLDSLSINLQLPTSNIQPLSHPGDSLFRKHYYHFLNDGIVLQSTSDTAATDTSYYEWNKKNELLVKKTPGDSTGKVYSIVKLDTANLVLLSEDSLKFLLSKAK